MSCLTAGDLRGVEAALEPSVLHLASVPGAPNNNSKVRSREEDRLD
jgi:hypothetical protein